ncbi:MAG: selenide, water dikinase SelD [Porphyromonas sp.]|nr:selenide, water dikinase SelD [Porphyromonas sp.]
MMSGKMSSTVRLLESSPYGGCSAKIDPKLLRELLSGFSLPVDERILVGISTHDDAGVYKLNEETALIVTTDFFPPMVDDPYTFGRIAATNALSDVYAMGGKPLLSLNLMHYPVAQLPLDGLADILRGGQSAVNEAGAFTMGGHTIEDETPQYGLAVVGIVHPDRLISNAAARPGQSLVLTKALGVGITLAAHRLGMADDTTFSEAISSMSRLNKSAAEVMTEEGITAATDVTGFGLIGHGMQLAEASDVLLHIETDKLPSIGQSRALVDEGCVPGAAFRNIRYVGDRLNYKCPVSSLYLAADPQTSGGILMAVDQDCVPTCLRLLRAGGDSSASVIGMVLPPSCGNVRVELV